MFDKEKAKLVENLNAVLGTKHRNKPYNLNNAADLKQALLLAVAAYRDYRHYLETLDGLASDFDESLENYDAASWFYLGQAPEKVDRLAADCVVSLNEASATFDRITERAKDNLAIVLGAALSAPSAAQKSVLGRTYKINPEDMDSEIDELLIMLDEVEYYYPIQENFDALLELMNEQWATDS